MSAMRQLSIRKLMLMIAGRAVAFALMAWLVGQPEYPRPGIRAQLHE